MKMAQRLRRGIDPAHAVLLLAAAGAAIVLLSVCLLRWRTPASGVECQYISAALHAKRVIAGEDALLVPLTHWSFALGNASLAGNLLAMPLLAAVPGRQSPFWISTILMCMASVMLVSVLVRRMLAAWPRDAAMLAGLAAGVCCLLAPLTVISAVSFTATAPATLCMLLALLAYQWARRRGTHAAWYSASFTLLLSWYAKPEWSVVFIPAMLLLYCVDEWAYGGWRDGLGAVCTMAGIVPCALFALHPWQADTASLVVFIRIVYLTGLWLVWVQVGGTRARRALAFALPAVWGAITWLVLFDNGSTLLRVLREHLHAHNGWALMAFYVRHQWAATLPALLVLIVLALVGLSAIVRHWPGLLVLGAALGYAAVRAPVAPQVQTLATFMITACCAGAGVAQLLAYAERWRVWSLPYRVQLAVVCGVLVCLALPGARRAIRDDIVPADLVRVPVFERSRTGWQVLAHIRAAVPRGAVCAYTPDTPAFSRLTLQAYAQLYGWEWDVQAWPAALAHTERPYLIVTLPGTGNIAARFFPDYTVAVHCAAQCAELDSHTRYRLIRSADVAGGAATVRVYHASAD